MPTAPMPASGGASETGDMDPAGARSPGKPGGDPNASRMGGEILLSKQETAALTALHFGAKDPKRAAERARRESGLTHQQIERLKARAEHARSKGMTLKGDRLVLKPTAPAESDEPGLLRDDVTGKDAEDIEREDAEKKAGKKEPYNTMRRSYPGRQVIAADHRVVGHNSNKAAKAAAARK